MRGKWTRNDDVSDGHSAKNKYVFDEPTFRPKLLHNSPSLRAIRTYNELHVDGNFHDGIDISVFQRRSSHPGRYDAASVISRDSLATNPVSESTDHHLYDYPTMGTYSMTNSGSELNSEPNESGSTVRLVATKMELSCQTWCTYLSTTLCTACMAAGIGNLYRLPQSALIRGGLPFLIVHIVLTLFVGLPLLFLELGIGQLAQEGLIKSSRAVPFFKGIGYVKLLAGCLLSVYYPLYMGISVFYITWILQGPLPFQECSSRVTITENGYSSVGKRGQQCLRETFLKPPLTNPYWYGIFAGFLLIVWILIAVLSIRKTKSYTRSLLILFFPTVAVYVALLVKSILLQNEFDSLSKFFYEADWTLLTSAGVWYFACIQVFFSTNVGFGSFVTNAGIMYNKVNPFWTAIGYIFVNILFGTGSVIISQSLTGAILNGTRLNLSAANGDVAELYLASFIYDFGSNSRSPDIKTWTVLAFCLFLLAGFINMATLTYTLFKAIAVQSRKKLKWWHVSIILSFLLYILGCAVLLQPDFDLVHLLDHYIVGNLILISTVIEVLALISFYGIERIRSDFEFMLGHILSRIWLLLWWASPIFLTGIFAWGMTTLPLEGIYKDDPAWIYGIGWGVVLCATLFIFIVGAYVVSQQDGYTLRDKLAASVKPSKNWGPKDPMSRHNWIQWNTKAQHGERDFTLKRKGTKDYTRSIKRSKKLANSELSNSSLPGLYKENSIQSRPHSNGSSIYNEVSNVNTVSRRVDNNFNLSGLSPTNTIDLNHYHSHAIPISNGIRSNNPLSHNTIYLNGSTPDEYGTFRKGPYIINDNVEHVCFRKYSESEEATEL